MNVNKVLSQDQKEMLLERSNWHGFYILGSTLLIIAATLAGVAAFPNPFTILIALILLGGQQLGLIVIMHEAVHHSLFRSRWLNEFVGQWFGAAPFMNNFEMYREYHLRHHKYTGTPGKHDKADPDHMLLRVYPVSKKAFRKMLVRDLTFVSGLRSYGGLAYMMLGLLKYELAGRVIRVPQPERSALQWVVHLTRSLGPFLLTHAILFSLFFFLGYWWFYVLWIGASLTTTVLYVRIRALAEHCLLDGDTDMLKNTRTTRANWLARLTVAPNQVNYHLEHHLMIGVPALKLPKFHAILKEKGVIDDSPVATGYGEVIKAAIY